MQLSQTKSSVTAADLIARAEALIPALRARAMQCEAECKVADETIRDFQEAGFFKILQPKRWGGYEMDPEVFYAVQRRWQKAVCRRPGFWAWSRSIIGNWRCLMRRRKPMSGRKIQARLSPPLICRVPK